MRVQIGVVIAILLMLASCGSNATSTPQASIATAEATTAITNQSTSTTGMTTYVDTRSGIAFDYPNGWTIVAPLADGAVIYTYSIASYDLTNPSSANDKTQDGLPFGQTKIDVSFYGADETPDSARRTVNADVDSGMAVVKKEETRTAPDGSPAYYYSIQGRLGGTAQVLYTSVDGHTVGIVAYGNGAHFEDVVKSLRKG